MSKATDGKPQTRAAQIAALLIGPFFMLLGLPFVLMWAGIIVPDPRSLRAPLWVIGCAGTAFMLAGFAVALNAASPGQTSDGRLPPSAPKALRILQDVAGLGIIAGLALVASWAALAPGEVKTTTTVLGATQSHSGESMIGRIIFGAGALTCWLLLFVLIRQRWWARQGSNL